MKARVLSVAARELAGIRALICGGGAEIARRLGASESAVRAWCFGARKPSGAARLAIERAFEIPVADWDTTPDKPRTQRTRTSEPGPALDELRVLVLRIDRAIDGCKDDPIDARKLSAFRHQVIVTSVRWRHVLARYGA